MDVVTLAARLLGPEGKWCAAVATELAACVVLGRVLIYTADRAGGLVREVGNGRRVEPIQGDTNVRRQETSLGEACGCVLAEWSTRSGYGCPLQLELTMRCVTSKVHLCRLPGILRCLDEVLVPVAGTRASK